MPSIYWVKGLIVYLEYFSMPEINAIQHDFKSNLCGPVTSHDKKETRSKLFEYFSSDSFKQLYLKIACEAAIRAKIPLDRLVVQQTPTPRIFEPKSHGTSMHCDYWYGHGDKSYTIWIPLTAIDPGNTFHICPEQLNQEALNFFTGKRGCIDEQESWLRKFEPVMMEPGSAIIFHSHAMHASPLNTSLHTRISFDFRIGERNDTTSTKDLGTYFRLINNQFSLSNPFLNMRFLKYICGGKGKNTLAQQLLIEDVAKFRKINIVAEEAEIERFGFPMLEAYLTGLAKDKLFDGIIIASHSLLNSEIIGAIKKSKIKVYAALENEFLN